MINNAKVLAVIPARGGSKGLPGKNIKPFCGRPLIHWTIDQAKDSAYIDDIIVSTDCTSIRKVVNQLGEFTPYMRPAHLASDSASMVDVIIDIMGRYPKYVFVVVLQPTSPLRSASDIDRAFEVLVQKNADSCVSVCKVDKSPYWMYTMNNVKQLEPILEQKKDISCRQHLPSVYALNGAIYLCRCSWLKHSKFFVTADTVAVSMPKSRSVDIDSLDDFNYAEYLSTLSSRRNLC